MTPMWVPSGAWKSNFRNELKSAFGAVDMNLLISDYFSPESFQNIAPVGPGINYDFQLFQLIEHARMSDWLPDLVAAAYERRPKNPDLAAFAKDLGVAGPRLDNPTGKPLEEIIQENAQFINPALFEQRLPILTGQVCWVEIPGGGGTGFLVGPDLLLTNDHVIERVRKGDAAWQDVRCIFDFKQTADGANLDKKKLPAVKLVNDAGKWLVDRLPPSQFDWDPTLGDAPETELDYALLRLAEPIGDSPVGGDTADSVLLKNPQPRGWIDVNVQPAPLSVGNQVFLLQHPKGEPLRLSIGTVKEFNGEKRTRMRYDANSQDGSSGSPCFNADLQLVALHHAYDPAFPRKWNQAVPLDKIKQAWKKNGVAIS
jgi:hypothetical protein